MSLTIWTNHGFDEDMIKLLRARVAPHKLVIARTTSKSNLAGGSREPEALEADVIYGQPHPDDLLESSRLKFVQLSTAGYTRYDRPDFFEKVKAKGIALCNASSLYDEPCAQHAAAMLLALARALPDARDDQHHARWDWARLRRQSFLLDGQKTLLVGYGAIARRLVELLTPYHLEMIAFRRSVRGDENVRTLPISELDAHLPTAQIVINILPLSDSTKNLFSAQRLSLLPKDAIYINIGRGDTNDQDALAQLLKDQKLKYAYLDVTAPEPLPAEHPLWKLPNCFITPHTAGGTFDEPLRMAEHFLANFDRFVKGQALHNRIA